jgi:hypothetical protein
LHSNPITEKKKKKGVGEKEREYLRGFLKKKCSDICLE